MVGRLPTTILAGAGCDNQGVLLRSVGAALLSGLVPGAGQLVARRPLRALLFFLPTVALTAGVLLFIDRGTLGMADLLVRPTFLTGLLILDVVLLAWRFAAVVDAFAITSKPGERGWLAIPLTLVLLIVAVPHVIAWDYGTRTISALNTTFTAGPPTGSVRFVNIPLLDDVKTDRPPKKPTIVRNVYRDQPRNAIYRQGLGDPDAVAVWLDIANTNIKPAPYLAPENPLDKDRLTILLVGGDAGPGREGLRTDSMNIATIDLKTGQAALFGLPRNMKLVPLPERFEESFLELEERVIEKDLTDEDQDGFPDHWVDLDGDLIPDEPEFESCKCWPTLLNEVHQYTLDWTSTYPYSPDPGLSALKDIISNLIDLPIDYFVMVEMGGFVDVIDAIGGVDVLVKEPYHVTVSAPREGAPKATVNVEPGMNHLDGLEALAYSRWRIGSSDYHRMRRQRCLVRAAVAQTDKLELIRAFPKLLDVVKNSVTTDIPLDSLPDLVWAAGQIDLDKIATVGFVPPTYNDGRTPGGYPIPNVPRIRAKVKQVLEEGVTAQSNSGESECS